MTPRSCFELKKKIAELERIIGQKQILIDFKDKIIELAEQEIESSIPATFIKVLVLVSIVAENKFVKNVQPKTNQNQVDIRSFFLNIYIKYLYQQAARQNRHGVV